MVYEIMAPATEPRNRDAIPPALVLHVERRKHQGAVLLRYILRWPSGELRCQQQLETDPYAYFEKLFERIEEIDPSETEGGVNSVAGQQVAGLCATLANHLLPAKLRQRLLSEYDPEREPDETAPGLLVISDEPWIPWELLRLRGTKGAGPHLAEAFAISRWPWERAAPLKLPLDRIGLVVPDPEDSELPATEGEGQDIHGLEEKKKRQVEDVPARVKTLLEAFAAGRFTGWHFAGHAWAEGEHADFWGLALDRGERLDPSDLGAAGCDLSGERPLVFLNACRSAKMNLSLSGFGGLAQAFLEAGAGAFLGTRWWVDDQQARAFARAFYELFLGGESIGEACRQARLRLRRDFPGEPTWLAYTLFAHPSAAVDGPMEPAPPVRQELPHSTIPSIEWNPDLSPPGALLRAECGIVPFHGRDEELSDLFAWCMSDSALRVRLYTGQGGMGKTRLALELCHRLRRQGWHTGFIQSTADASPRTSVRAIVGAGGPSLIVLDYAETRRGLLVPLLRKLVKAQDNGPFRLILLARWREHWWMQLQMESEGVGDLIAGPATAHHGLTSLASSLDERAAAYRIACEAFAHRLQKPVPQGLPKDIEADYFEPVLMLHMSALGSVEGELLGGEDSILDWVLDRERSFWSRQLEERKLPRILMSGVGRAMSAITLAGGMMNEGGTVRLLEALKFFRGQTYADLTDVAHLMHDTYPGEHWVMPVQPDILGEHLLERELVEDEQEIYDLVAGPRL